MGYDKHIETTNIPGKVNELVAMSYGLLQDSEARHNPFIEVFEEGKDAVWTRRDETAPQHYIQLGIHALKGGRALISFNSHRPLEHRFPEPPVDLNGIVQVRPFEQVGLSVYPLSYREGDAEFDEKNPDKARLFPVLFPSNHGRPDAPLYVSSPNPYENRQAAVNFEKALDQFKESLFLNFSLLGLAHEAQERRIRSATSASAA